MANDSYRNPSREAKHQQDLLEDYFNHMVALAGQEDRIWDVSTKYPVGRRSWHLSVLFRTTQLFQELLLKLVLLKFPTNFQRKSNFFSQFFFCLQICKIFLSSKSSKSLGNLKRFSKVRSEKVGSKSQNYFPKCQSFLKSVFSFFCHFLFWGGPKFHWLCSIFLVKVFFFFFCKFFIQNIFFPSSKSFKSRFEKFEFFFKFTYTFIHSFICLFFVCLRAKCFVWGSVMLLVLGFFFYLSC